MSKKENACRLRLDVMITLTKLIFICLFPSFFIPLSNFFFFFVLLLLFFLFIFLLSIVFMGVFIRTILYCRAGDLIYGCKIPFWLFQLNMVLDKKHFSPNVFFVFYIFHGSTCRKVVFSLERRRFSLLV